MLGVMGRALTLCLGLALLSCAEERGGPVKVSDSPQGWFAYGSQVAIDAEGNAVVTWLEWSAGYVEGQRVKVARLNAEADRWSAPQRLDPGDPPEPQAPRLLLTAQGETTAIWNAGPVNFAVDVYLAVEMWTAQGDAEGNWTAALRDQEVLAPRGHLNDFASSPSGTQVALWSSVSMLSPPLGYAIKTGTGAWERSGFVDSLDYPVGQNYAPGPFSQPRIGIDDSGDMLVTAVGHGLGGSPDGYFVVGYDADADNWSQAVAFPRPEELGESVQFLPTSGHAAALVWRREEGDTRSVFAARFDGQWGQTVRLAQPVVLDSELFGPRLTLAKGPAGEVLVAWADEEMQRLTTVRFDSEVARWSAPHELAGTMTSGVWSIDFQAGPQSDLILAWHNHAEDEDDVWASRFDTELGAWEPPTLIDSATGRTQDEFTSLVSASPQVAVGAQGQAVVVWSRLVPLPGEQLMIGFANRTSDLWAARF